MASLGEQEDPRPLLDLIRTHERGAFIAGFTAAFRGGNSTPTESRRNYILKLARRAWEEHLNA